MGCHHEHSEFGCHSSKQQLFNCIQTSVLWANSVVHFLLHGNVILAVLSLKSQDIYICQPILSCHLGFLLHFLNYLLFTDYHKVSYLNTHF